MSLSLGAYRAKLINKISFAASPEEVKRYIDTGIKALEQNKVNGHIVARFVEKTISELEQFNPLKAAPRQWSNIQMAKIQFNRIKQQLGATAN